jgi:hypothetical protein
MSSLPITEAEFEAGCWLAKLPELLALPRQPHRPGGGADMTARFIYQRLENKE